MSRRCRMPILDIRQPKVFPQAVALVFMLKQPPALQLGHHAFGEVADAFVQAAEHHVETIRRACFKPLLKIIGDALWGADQDSVPTRRQLVEQLTNRGTLAADQIENQFLAALVGVGVEGFRR